MIERINENKNKPSRKSSISFDEVYSTRRRKQGYGETMSILIQQMDKMHVGHIPLGVFWDIENCSVPRSKSALHVVHTIRELLFKEKNREVEFMCVCDTSKENKTVIQELNQAQVNVVHIDAISKNAADDKLRQNIRRFSDIYTPPAVIVLITSDINFSSDLYDLRYRKKFDIVLLHRKQTHDSLVLCATEHFIFDDVVKDVPSRSPSKSPERHDDIVVTGYPPDKDCKKVKHKLLQLCNNTGGKVVSVTSKQAVIRFMSGTDAERARYRMEGHEVFGSRIHVDYSGHTTADQSNSYYGHYAGGPGNELSGNHIPNVSPDRDRPYSQKKSKYHKKSVTFNPDENNNSNNNNLTGTLSQEDEFVNPHVEDVHQSIDGSYGLQGLVQKFSQENKSSRQQMYQEGQTPIHAYSPHSTQFYSQYRDNTNYYTSQQPQGDYQSGTGHYHGYQQPYNDNSKTYYNSSYQSAPQNAPSTGYYGNRGFNPIRTTSSNSSSTSSSPCEFDVPNDIPGSVDLIISNLDYNISPREWKHILMTTFHPHVKILHIDVSLQPDNTSLGLCKVGSIEEARFAISQFHRKKIGYKRIHVTLKSTCTESIKTVSNVRSEAIALLSEAKGNVLPLFKFIELFNKRFNRPISVSELYKMRDTIEVREQGGAGRMIHLVPSLQGSPVPEDKSDGEVQEILEHVVCLYHCPEGSSMFAEAINTSILPNVKVQLKTFGAQVHSLLMTHDGNLPLKSFTACYAAEVMPLAFVYEGGVPLEHLISCVPGIEIITSSTGVKKVSWSENKTPSSPDLNRPGSSPLLVQQLNQISREMVDLLKSSPGSRMAFSKFIPSYHHHFGRQCRVADYGYSKLLELFEAIPHVCQILGTGDRKVLTLTHRANMKRFTADLQRLLKNTPGKQLYLSSLTDEFCKFFNKNWDVTEYGVCYIEDILAELPTGTVSMMLEGTETVISLPRKDQNSEEIERTKQFALEVIDILKHSHQCRMMFNKFIPSYHHHFGRQCRVSDYGFLKLQDLFEAIPNVVELEDEGEEKIIRLTEPELRKVVGEQIVNMLRQKKVECFPLDKLQMTFTHHYGYQILLNDFSVFTVEELMAKLKHVLKVEQYDSKSYIVLADRTSAPPLARQVLQLLMDESGGSLPLMELSSRYKTTFGIDPDVKKIKEELLDYVSISGDDESGVISLTPLQILARDIRILLQQHGKVSLQNFERLYYEKFCMEIKPALYGFPSMVALLMAIPHVVSIKGKGQRRIVHLSGDLQIQAKYRKVSLQNFERLYYEKFCMEIKPALHRFPSMVALLMAIPHVVSIKGKGQRRIVHLSGDLQSSLPIIDESYSRTDSDTLSNDSGSALIDEDTPTEKLRPSPLDLLGGTVPSNVPSPQILPSQTDSDLMTFSPCLTDFDGGLFSLSEEEKRNLDSPLCHTPTSQILKLAAQFLPTTTDPTKMAEHAGGLKPAILNPNLHHGQANTILDMLKQGWWKDGQPPDQSTELVKDQMESNKTLTTGKDSSTGINTTKPDPSLKPGSLSATISLLRRQSSGQEKVTDQNQKPEGLIQGQRDLHGKMVGGEGNTEEGKTGKPIALCPRPLQPGSYWFSKQFQHKNQAELPCTSPEDVRKVLASLSSQHVKPPSHQDTNQHCNDKKESKVVKEDDLVQNLQDKPEYCPTETPISEDRGKQTDKIVTKTVIKGTKAIFTESNIPRSAKHKEHVHKLENCVAEDCMCYEAVFREDHDFATSTVKSDSSLTDSQSGSPTKSPNIGQQKLSTSSHSDESHNSSLSRLRKCRIAAKFERPVST